MAEINLSDPPDIQEITTAQLREVLVGNLKNMSDAELEDLIETGGVNVAQLLPGGLFRVQSNCDGTHFLVYARHREVSWPPKCLVPFPKADVNLETRQCVQDALNRRG